ncbi:MAG: succinate dehydrogenase assembly factor 2 [Methylococcaceae bacterium]|jgi:antitoxin CptB|nr:succinate dehydrogenase assembly factor 2 [Methylococcaceae bacterium]MDZ4156065.1 succinate dehydrogenase assembly factor 2 [Methylococcales bacterium]MDP2395116.1 succinate dehydrogenase assembly factor 2 [Methylococcaceae bacterium]MDP3018742.1 succinate dehydrogenase assembly factor 2 [Methylococcaceae bacterium]MDP3390541.1 succinate dehydrogenase assembly factor 2 [Methylococcaceae bacterium]
MPVLAKLRWQCRRGTKELDLVLQRYLQTDYSQASKEEKTLFTELLSLEDDLLASYLLGEAVPASPQLVVFISNLKKPHYQTLAMNCSSPE